MSANAAPAVSIVVPTYGREGVLLDTLARLLALSPPARELIVVDQTPAHEALVAAALEAWSVAGSLLWVRRPHPSIPAAMNAGLLAARSEVVLFVDDDVEPATDLVGRHAEAHGAGRGDIVAGQVLQPGEAPGDGAEFSFRSTRSREIGEFMGGNFSVRREFALAIGGFDEQFRAVAYRFERDFAVRARAAGGRIWYAAPATLRHQRAERGGTRSFGSHLRTLGPAHAVGEYYFLLRHRPPAWRRSAVRRLAGSVLSRHHLRRPWWIPATLLAESLGLVWAAALALRGPRLLGTSEGAAR